VSAQSGRVLQLDAELRALNITAGYGSSYGVISIDDSGNFTVQDKFLTSPIALSEFNVTGLVGYLATSIIGALNEAKNAPMVDISVASHTVLASDEYLHRKQCLREPYHNRNRRL